MEEIKLETLTIDERNEIKRLQYENTKEIGCKYGKEIAGIDKTTVSGLIEDLGTAQAEAFLKKEPFRTYDGIKIYKATQTLLFLVVPDDYQIDADITKLYHEILNVCKMKCSMVNSSTLVKQLTLIASTKSDPVHYITQALNTVGFNPLANPAFDFAAKVNETGQSEENFLYYAGMLHSLTRDYSCTDEEIPAMGDLIFMKRSPELGSGITE